LDQARGLEQRLELLGLGIGRPRDAAADVEAELARLARPVRAAPHERADQDVPRRVAARVDEAERAGEEAATLAFLARDRRHAGELGRAGDRAAGEQRRERVERVATLRELG